MTNSLFRKKTFVSEKIQGQQVVLNHETGELITLNETASAIWEYLSKPKSLNEILSKISLSYEEPNKQEINLLLNHLLKAGLVIKGKKK